MQRVSEKRRGHQATLGVALVPRVKVLLPLPLAGAYDYRVPSSMSLNSGDFVVVPLNHRDVIGVVWDSSPEQETVSVLDHKLRPVSAMLAHASRFSPPDPGHPGPSLGPEQAAAAAELTARVAAREFGVTLLSGVT